MADLSSSPQSEHSRLLQEVSEARSQFTQMLRTSSNSEFYLERVKKLENIRSQILSQFQAKKSSSPRRRESEVLEGLYADAIDRGQRQKERVAAAIDEANEACNASKVSRKSHLLALQKLEKDVDSALTRAEDLEGMLGLNGFKQVLCSLGVLRISEDDEMSLNSVRNERLAQEKEFVQRAWKLLCPDDATYIRKELAYDLLVNLLHPSLSVEDLTDLVKNLIETVETLTDTAVQLPCSLQKFVSSARKLVQNRLAYISIGTLKDRQKEQIQRSEAHLTFRPEINEASRKIDDEQSSPTNRYELLYKKQQKTNEKLLRMRIEKLEKEVSSCTFVPDVKATSKSQQSFMPVNLRLYELRNAPKGVTDNKTTIEKELEQCTFKPNIAPKQPPRPASGTLPRGFDNSIARIRTATQEKQEFQKRIEHIPAGENYYKIRKMKPKPFSFMERTRPKREVLIYVDVNIAPGKCGKIAVHEGDDLKLLAENFARTFHLSNEMKEVLEEMLMEQVEAHLSSRDGD
mmetsp:Transcript_26623/g.47886  ORF Transcript_26623/g.47886 Transcript_26623/m.47886 type:complete len:517 (-) Transcript_26623:25-1575(-)